MLFGGKNKHYALILLCLQSHPSTLCMTDFYKIGASNTQYNKILLQVYDVVLIELSYFYRLLTIYKI